MQDKIILQNGCTGYVGTDEELTYRSALHLCCIRIAGLKFTVLKYDAKLSVDKHIALVVSEKQDR